MNNALRWVLALGIAAASVIGGAVGVTATTAEDAPPGPGYELAGHDDGDEHSGDKSGKGDKGNNEGDGGKDDDGGDSSDKGDDDASDVNDTDGPGDDEDD